MARYNWTKKRKKALECLVRAGGNVRLAAEISGDEVSEAYIHNLKYDDEHTLFREQFYRLTQKLLNEMEVDVQFVISRLVNISDTFPAPQRIQALKLLGDYLGIWAPEKRELSVEVIYRIKELGLDAEEVVAEAERIVRDAYRGSGGLAGD